MVILELLITRTKLRESLPLGALHQLRENWSEVVSLLTALHFVMKLRGLTPHTPLSAHPARWSTEQPRKTKEDRRAISRERGNSGGRETDRRSFQEASPPVVSIHYWVLRSDVWSGPAKPSFTLVLSCFYPQGSRSWEGVNFIINYPQKMRSPGLYLLPCLSTGCLCSREWSLLN